MIVFHINFSEYGAFARIKREIGKCRKNIEHRKGVEKFNKIEIFMSKREN